MANPSTMFPKKPSNHNESSILQEPLLIDSMMDHTLVMLLKPFSGISLFDTLALSELNAFQIVGNFKCETLLEVVSCIGVELDI